MLLCSCDQWLTIEPEDGVIKDRYWSTKEEVYAAVIGLYSGMLQPSFIERFYLWGELRGDLLLTNESHVNDTYQAIRDGEITSSNALCDWSSFYNIINFCNTVEAYAENACATDPSFKTLQVKEYQAEAVAIRSLLYFYLVRTFGDIPYYTEPYVSDDQTMMIAKSPGDSVLMAVSEDLKQHYLNLPERYGETSDVNKGRITRFAACAILADINLWLENYSECVNYCNMILNSGKYALLMNSADNFYEYEFANAETNEQDTIQLFFEESANNFFKQLYVDGNSDESIFEIQVESDYPNTTYYKLFNNSNGCFMVNQEVMDDNYFLPSEINAKEWVDLRYEDVTSKGGYAWKFLGLSRDQKLLDANRPTQDDWTGNIIVYRLAEIYLMKAEALIEQAAALEGASRDEMLNEALDLIYVIRHRANATETTDLFSGVRDSSDLSVTTAEQFVYQERVRELSLEGKRWFDALRFAKRGNYANDNLNYLQQVATYGASVTKVSTLQNKMKNPNFHYLPISKSELEANKLLVQNPFYND